MSLDPSTNSGGRGHRILGGECLEAGGRRVENLTTWPRATAAKGTTRKMEERMVFFFRVVNRLVKEGKGWCVDIIIKKPPILFVMYGAAASFDKLYISLSL